LARTIRCARLWERNWRAAITADDRVAILIDGRRLIPMDDPQHWQDWPDS
jgi:hypothetical protein